MGMTGPELEPKHVSRVSLNRMPYVCHGDCVRIRALNPAGVQTLIHKCMAAPRSSKHLCIPPGRSVYICGSGRLKCLARRKPR